MCFFAGGQFVAVGGQPNDHSTILTSPDGQTWTEQTVAASQFLTGAAHDGSIYVAVGEAGTLLSSPDAITWTARASSTFQELQGVTYAGNQFIAVGFGGTILSSPDAITWTPSKGEGILLSVTAGNDRYLTTGFSVVMSSVDGAVWSTLSEGSTDALNDMAYGNDVYIAVGDAGALLRSVSGIIWSEEDSTVGHGSLPGRSRRGDLCCGRRGGSDPPIHRRGNLDHPDEPDPELYRRPDLR
jgi:hypothetical protein